MKKFYIFSIVVLVLVQCSTYHRAEKNLVVGNFDKVLDLMIKKKSKGVKDKNYEQWVILFQQSYIKANESDLMEIQRASNDVESIQKYQIIYNSYQNLQNRQKKVSSLLPLYINDKKILIETNDYSSKLAESKENLVNALVKDAQNNMATYDKLDARDAYYDYLEVSKLMPFYTNINQLMNEAHQQGLNHVLVSINNYSYTFLPSSLEMALTEYSFMSNKKFWYKFYDNYSENVNFDYEVELNFDKIWVSRDEEERNHIKFEKEIPDGEEYLRDESGHRILDSLERPIKVQKFIIVEGEVEEVILFKSSSISAQLKIFQNGYLLDQYPLASDFVFEDYSLRIWGDERAIDEVYLEDYKRHSEQFPRDGQMIYDNGIQLKRQLRDIINDYFQ